MWVVGCTLRHIQSDYVIGTIQTTHCAQTFGLFGAAGGLGLASTSTHGAAIVARQCSKMGSKALVSGEAVASLGCRSAGKRVEAQYSCTLLVIMDIKRI